MTYPAETMPRRRRWPIFAPLAIVIILALGWTALWFYASGAARTAIDGWRAREAQAGRVYSCGREDYSGFPFRIEVRCAAANAELRNPGSALALKLNDVVVAAQIYQPNLLIAELAGPLTIGEVGRSPDLSANWKLAQVSARGTPSAPERVSIALDQARFDRIASATQETIVSANRIELHGRLAGGTVDNNPVIEVAAKLGGALAPSVHPLLGAPLDADLAVTLHGLRDFAPKPWPDRFRELQAQDGRLVIANIRLAQGELLAIGAGTLKLTPRGGLDGQLQVTVAGIDRVLKQLKLDLPAQDSPAVSALDRLLPGLGNIARQNAGPALAAGLSFIGQPTTLEGRQAVSLPLRFADWAVFLGPLPVGRVPPLF